MNAFRVPGQQQVMLPVAQELLDLLSRTLFPRLPPRTQTINTYDVLWTIAQSSSSYCGFMIHVNRRREELTRANGNHITRTVSFGCRPSFTLYPPTARVRFIDSIGSACLTNLAAILCTLPSFNLFVFRELLRVKVFSGTLSDVFGCQTRLDS